jgi:hypothetical protein
MGVQRMAGAGQRRAVEGRGIQMTNGFIPNCLAAAVPCILAPDSLMIVNTNRGS